ncbi:hypothetical protein [Streptomyces cadmiisoli]|uniref:hypothetical protein n=1 Tax=Streptomyces cadmiisoli TaxID=2184053 RepID=UPI003D732191
MLWKVTTLSIFPTKVDLLLSVLTIALVTGCATGSGGTPDNIPVQESVTPTATNDAPTPVPVEKYLLSDEEWHTLEKADHLLRKRCMQRFGFAYPITFKDSEPLGYSLTTYRYGILDPDYATQNGYRTPRALNARSVDQENRKRNAQLEELSYAAKLVLFGVQPEKNGRPVATGENLRNYEKIPKGGCLNEALKSLYGDSSAGTDSPVAVDVNLKSFNQTLRDPSVLKAFAGWSSCMKRKGYVYATPMQASGDPRWAASPGSSDEKVTAKADVECKIQHNVAGVWNAADVSYQNRMIKRHSTELRAVETSIDRQVERARAILAKSDSE